MSDIDQIILELKCLGEVAEVEGMTVEGNELHPIINAAWEAIAALKEQNALLTVQVQDLVAALDTAYAYVPDDESFDYIGLLISDHRDTAQD